MPAYLKFDGVDGESTDNFIFVKGADRTPVDDLGVVPDEQMIGLLLPAVQRAHEPRADPLPTEDFTLNYEGIDWIY